MVSALSFQDFNQPGQTLANTLNTNAQTQQLIPAQVAQMQANTTGLNIQNQVAAARAKVSIQALQALQDFQTSSDNSGANGAASASSGNNSAKNAPQKGGTPDDTQASDDSGDSETIDPNSSWYNPAQRDAVLRQRFFVNPAGTPDEIKAYVLAANAGAPDQLAAAKIKRELGIQQRLADSQKDASNMYDSMQAVTDAPPGKALYTLEAVAPKTAAKIKASIPDDADEDAAARAFAAHMAGAVHQYTGREVVARADGEYVDKVTGKPVPGIEKSGMTEDQWAQLAKSGMEMVDKPMSDGSKMQMPRWQASNSPSLSEWVMKIAAHGGAPGALGTISGAPVAAAHAAVRKAAADPGNQPATSGTPPAPPGSQGAKGTELAAALADQDFKLPPQPKPVAGVTPSTVQAKQQEALGGDLGAKTAELYSNAQTATKAAAQAQVFFKAAQDILDKGGAGISSGAYNKVLAEASRYVGVPSGAASNYQELSKYLTNAALFAAKSIFPKMTDKATAIQLNLASPNPSMDEKALRDLLKENSANVQYAIDSARRVDPYVKSRNDPRNFDTWNQKHFPMEQVVNASTSPATSSAKPMPTGAKLTAYAKKYTNGDEKAAQEALRAHGYQ